MSDIRKGYEGRIEDQIIRDRDTEIKRLEGKLIVGNSLIACFKQENMQLKVNQMIQYKQAAISKKEDAKGKVVVEMKVSKGKGKKSTLRR